MAKGGQIGGQGHPIKRGIWVFVAACIAVAVWGGALTDPGAVLTNLKTKSQQLEQTVRGWVADLGLTSDGTPKTPIPQDHTNVQPQGVPAAGGGVSTPAASPSR